MENKRRFSLLVLLALLALCVQAQYISPRRNLGTASRSRNVGTDWFGRPNRRTEASNQSRNNESNRPRTVETEQQDKKGKSKSASNTSAADEVTLVVSGEGPTKDEATKVALRSAIEQAFGTFVSSNTQILDDELVKDEIVTVSSGNIKKYDYISATEVNGTHCVTVKATVSVGKLISYAKAHGGEVELAGATFAMNIKMEKLYAENEKKAMYNLLKQMESMIPYAFDYSLSADEPVQSGNGAVVDCRVSVTATSMAADITIFSGKP